MSVTQTLRAERTTLINARKLIGTVLLAISTFSADANAAPTHPLDPLNAEELAVIRDVLAKSGRFSAATKFAWIELEEPPKALVEHFEPGRAVARRAYLTALDFGNQKSFAVRIDLAAKHLESVEDLGALQPGLTAYDLDRAREILDRDPRIKAALLRRGLRIPGLVSDSVREMFLGVGEDPSLMGEAGRLVRVLFISDQDAINDYGPVLDSPVAVVDVYGGRVVRLDTGPSAPIPKVPHDVFDAKVRGSAGANVKLLRTQGRNFTINADAVRWANWRFRIGFNGREGLVLRQVRIDDGGRQRPVLYRASVSEAISRYGDPNGAWPWMEFLDEGNFGLGERSAPVTPGREVPPNAATLSPLAADADAPGFGRVLHDRIYVYERDAGLLMYYRQGAATVQARGTELVVGFLAVAGNYTYGLNWVFKQDGSFAFEAELAGEVLTKMMDASGCDGCRASDREQPSPGSSSAPARSRPDGMMVHPGVIAMDHQHWFNLRLDFDIDGPNNAVVENEARREVAPASEPHSAAVLTATHRVLRTAAEAKRDTEDSDARTWTVYNPANAGPAGRPAGYAIVPVENAATIFPGSRERGPVGFTFHHLWVTPYRDGELYAGGKYPDQPPPDYADTLYHYADQRSIYDRDIIVWYSLGETHVVRPEDYPLMSNMKLSVRFVPDGFFARNPALGRAVQEGKVP
jgi:primary-amine oxidase